LKKKILLYNPKAVFYDMPLALLSIGSALDNEYYEVIIVDGRICKNPKEKLKEHLKGALCFAVTVLTGSPIQDALEVSKFIKDQDPTLPVIWGGWHPSLFGREILEETNCVDIAVQGQGEATFRELVAVIEAGGSLDLVKGINYRSEDGNIVSNENRELVDVNNLPKMDYDLVDVQKYFDAKKKRQLDYITSIGCRFRCTFCADPFVYERKWYGLDSMRIADELNYWYKKYQIEDVNFQDETFFTKRQRITDMCDAFLTKGMKITWAGTMRADQASRMTDEDFDLCKEAGLRRVLVGVESGSQEMMDWMKKDIKLEQVYLTAERCARRNISVIFPFIVGFPGESYDSVKESIKVARELNAMHPSFTTPIFYFKPYPGSKITQEVTKKGFELPATLSEWAKFDYIGSSGPWVDQKKYRLIENFKFYNKLAWRKNPAIFYLFQKIAQFRCEKEMYKFPIEKYMADLFFPSTKLS
jgi:radical SAM superfamily enzyme YgiQ (UPF0313 family)